MAFTMVERSGRLIAGFLASNGVAAFCSNSCTGLEPRLMVSGTSDLLSREALRA